MFGKSITLFKMFGFAVRVDLSWIIILVLVVWSLAAGVFPREYEGFDWAVYLGMGLASALGLFGSIVFHELCHSLVARRYGVPMEGITLFLFGGVAEMGDEPESPKAEFMMAVAGPVASIIVSAVFLSLYYLGASLNWPMTVLGVLRWIGLINALLAVFNLIPGFPLDGGRVLRSILWYFTRDLRKATESASRAGSAFGMALIVFGFLFLLMGNPIGGLWWILIGMFLRSAARQGLQQVVIRQLLRGEPVRRFMNDRPVSVPPSLSLKELVENYVYRYHFKMFPVVEGQTLSGCISTREVAEVPREKWAETRVADVMAGCGAENTLSADEDAMEALTRMSRTKTSRMMVVDKDGTLIGIVSLKDLLRFLALKLELESDVPTDLPLESPDAQATASLAGAQASDENSGSEWRQ